MLEIVCEVFHIGPDSSCKVTQLEFGIEIYFVVLHTGGKSRGYGKLDIADYGLGELACGIIFLTLISSFRAGPLYSDCPLPFHEIEKYAPDYKGRDYEKALSKKAMAYITSCRNQAEPVTTAHLTPIFSLYEKLSDRYLPYLTEKTTIAAMPERAMEYDMA